MIHTYLRPLLQSLWCFRSWPSVCSCTLEFRIFSNHDFLSSRLPSCRIPSCWMDGIHAICLSTGQKVVTESLRKCDRRPHRSSSRFLMGQGNYTLTTAYCHPFWWRFSHRFWDLSCHCLGDRETRDCMKAFSLIFFASVTLSQFDFSANGMSARDCYCFGHP